MSQSRCINRLSSTIILKDSSVEEINEYVKRVCAEYYVVSPGFEFRGVAILLDKPMFLGFRIKRNKILLPFKKPCFGPMLYEVDAEEGDFASLRERLGKTNEESIP